MSTQAKIAIEQAKLAAKSGDYKRARAILREAAQYDPNNEELFLVFARVAQKREHAIQCYQRVLEINPYNLTALEALDKVQAQQEARQAAVDKAKATVAKGKSVGGIFSPLGKIPFKRMFIAFVRLVLLGAVVFSGAVLGYNLFFKASEITGFTPGGAMVQATPSPTRVPATPVPTVALPEIQSTYEGRIFVQVGDPAEHESVWSLLFVEGWDRSAIIEEGGKDNWYETNIRLKVDFEAPHQVKFRLTYKNPYNNRATPIQFEELIQPNNDLGLGPRLTQSLNVGFTQWSSGESLAREIEVLDVQILRIDGQREEEWEPPEGGPGQFRDIWILSNPHSIALPLAWQILKQDSQGQWSVIQEYNFCTQSTDDEQMLLQEFSLLPPGESIIVSQDLPLEEAQTGVATELKLLTLDSCQPLHTRDVVFDPDVVLIETGIEEGEAILILENRGTNESFGMFYINMYDSGNHSIAGRVITLDASNFPISPSEILELMMPLDFIDLVHPAPANFDFVFLGLTGELSLFEPVETPPEFTVTPTAEP